MRRALLAMPWSVQYESAREYGKQMNVELRAEPFTKRQQRQRRMDGNCDIDDIPRPLVEIHGPAVQLHIEREACRARVENRQPHFGSSAQFSMVSLTGCFQASFPA